MKFATVLGALSARNVMVKDPPLSSSTTAVDDPDGAAVAAPPVDVVRDARIAGDELGGRTTRSPPPHAAARIAPVTHSTRTRMYRTIREPPSVRRSSRLYSSVRGSCLCNTGAVTVMYVPITDSP